MAIKNGIKYFILPNNMFLYVIHVLNLQFHVFLHNETPFSFLVFILTYIFLFSWNFYCLLNFFILLP